MDKMLTKGSNSTSFAAFHRSSTVKYSISLDPKELKFIKNCKAKVFRRFILEKENDTNISANKSYNYEGNNSN